MAYKKKIDLAQFIKDCVDFELKPYGVGWEYIANLPEQPTNEDDVDPNAIYKSNWYNKFKFKTTDDYIALKKYFYEHWKDYAPRYDWRKFTLDKNFGWFILQYGLSYDFDYQDLLEADKENDIYKIVYIKKTKN